MKKLKDFAHFYKNGQIWEEPDNVGTLLGIADFGHRTSFFIINCSSNEPYWQPGDFLKLVVRPLSDMKEEEMKELWQVVFDRPFGANGHITRFEKTDEVPRRFVLHSGVERLGIQHDGHVWADSDLHNYKYNHHKVTACLFKNGFDALNLLQEQPHLVIDKTTLPKKR